METIYLTTRKKRTGLTHISIRKRVAYRVTAYRVT